MPIAQQKCRPGVQLTYLHLPIPPDGDAVIADEILKPFLSEVVGLIRSGSVVYMHCDCGDGRAGTVASIAYALLEGVGSNEAIDRTQIMRNQRPGPRGVFVELPSQKLQVHRVLADRAWCSRARSQAPTSIAQARAASGSSAVRPGQTMAIGALHERIRGHWARGGAMASAKLIATMQRLSVTPGSLDVRFGDMAICFDRAEMPMTHDEVRVLANFHETTTNSAIASGHALLAAICGSPSPWRQSLFDAAWSKVQDSATDRSGLASAVTTVGLHELVRFNDAAAHPRVQRGLATEAQLRGDITVMLRSLFPDMRIDRARFVLWVGLMSASVLDDATFEDLVWRVWRLSSSRTAVPLLSSTPRAATIKPRSTVALLPSSPMPSGGALTAKQGSAKGTAVVKRILHQLTFARIADNRMISRGVRALIAFEAGLRENARPLTSGQCRAAVHMTDLIVIMKQCTIMFNDTDLDEIHNAFAVSSNEIDGEALVAVLIGRLSPARWQLVGQAFSNIDVGGKGYVTLHDFLRRYTADQHPSVLAGRTRAEKEEEDFTFTFKTQSGLEVPDQRVTLQHMLDYYTRVGAVTSDDALFSSILWRTWNFGSSFSSSGFGSRPHGKNGVVFTRGALRGSQKNHAGQSVGPRAMAAGASGSPFSVSRQMPGSRTPRATTFVSVMRNYTFISDK